MSNHIGDSNKMVSESPRTNKEAFLPHDSKYRVCDADFARTLERELNAANQRIKQLEEALEATAMIIGPPGHSEWATDDEINRAWGLYVQTKEAKP